MPSAKVLGTKFRCGWTGLEKDVLSAPNPFDPEDDLTGCPECKGVNTIVPACDEPGCWEEVTCGAPTPSGYRQTCGKHRPK